MKQLENLIQSYSSTSDDNSNLIIEVLLRRGVETVLQAPLKINEMVCQDRGCREGHSYRSNRRGAWFCGNTECLATDRAMTLRVSRQEWAKKRLMNEKQAEKNKRNKKWDGT